MHERDRARGPEETDRREPAVQPLRLDAAEGVLALQRGAGNQAVSAYLARSPDAGAPTEERKPASGAAAGSSATLPGIGTIALLSVSFGGGDIGSRPGKVLTKDVVFSSRVGEHSAKLMKASFDGNPMAVEVVLQRGKSTHRIKLTGAIVSSYSTTGGENATESWTLNAQEVEHSFEGERDE